MTYFTQITLRLSIIFRESSFICDTESLIAIYDKVYLLPTSDSVHDPLPGTIEYYKKQFEQSSKAQAKQKDGDINIAKNYQALQNIIKYRQQQQQIAGSCSHAITTADINEEVTRMNKLDEGNKTNNNMTKQQDEQQQKLLAEAFQNVSKRPGIVTIDAIYAEAKRLLRDKDAIQ